MNIAPDKLEKLLRQHAPVETAQVGHSALRAGCNTMSDALANPIHSGEKTR